MPCGAESRPWRSALVRLARAGPTGLDHFRPKLLLALSLDLGPFALERGQQDGLQERLDVGAAGVVGADLRTLGGVQRPLEERAEDRRLDAGPIVLVDVGQGVDFRRGQRQAPRRRRTGRR